ncbi:MAG: hypothetical protein HQL67_12970 [Magnetococcales bacterium]|nr:hypothetical protein [Magnetococcales bacterium]
MEKQRKDRSGTINKTQSTVFLLAALILVTPNMVRADSQDLGNKVGQFVNSFLEGLDDTPAEETKANRQSDPKMSSPTAQTNRTGSTQDIYDPWGVSRQNNYSPFQYDPWGVTRETDSLERFADRDWAYGQNYYGTGFYDRYGWGYGPPPDGQYYGYPTTQPGWRPDGRYGGAVPKGYNGTGYPNRGSDVRWQP